VFFANNYTLDALFLWVNTDFFIDTLVFFAAKIRIITSRGKENILLRLKRLKPRYIRKQVDKYKT
ncbi:MAG: hypothetical protein O4808_13160, partial [Trichodesmium sp. St17_bin3_1_1]|nr:hypothetical protein [Trichodesmium sp. St17_bin3_1_1]